MIPWCHGLDKVDWGEDGQLSSKVQCKCSTNKHWLIYYNGHFGKHLPSLPLFAQIGQVVKSLVGWTLGNISPSLAGGLSAKFHPYLLPRYKTVICCSSSLGYFQLMKCLNKVSLQYNWQISHMFRVCPLNDVATESCQLVPSQATWHHVTMSVDESGDLAWTFYRLQKLQLLSSFWTKPVCFERIQNMLLRQLFLALGVGEDIIKVLIASHQGWLANKTNFLKLIHQPKCIFSFPCFFFWCRHHWKGCGQYWLQQ